MNALGGNFELGFCVLDRGDGGLFGFGEGVVGSFGGCCCRF